MVTGLRAEIGGGALYDMGCYAINAQRMIAGREPLTAWATMEWSERFDVDMAGTAMLDFGDGLLCYSLDLCRRLCRFCWPFHHLGSSSCALFAAAGLRIKAAQR